MAEQMGINGPHVTLEPSAATADTPVEEPNNFVHDVVAFGVHTFIRMIPGLGQPGDIILTTVDPQAIENVVSGLSKDITDIMKRPAAESIASLFSQMRDTMAMLPALGKPSAAKVTTQAIWALDSGDNLCRQKCDALTPLTPLPESAIKKEDDWWHEFKKNSFIATTDKAIETLPEVEKLAEYIGEEALKSAALRGLTAFGVAESWRQPLVTWSAILGKGCKTFGFVCLAYTIGDMLDAMKKYPQHKLGAAMVAAGADVAGFGGSMGFASLLQGGVTRFLGPMPELASLFGSAAVGTAEGAAVAATETAAVAVGEAAAVGVAATVGAPVVIASMCCNVGGKCNYLHISF